MAKRRFENTDGRFVLEHSDGYAVLVVHPPTGSGKPVYVEDVQGRMSLLGISAANRARIAQVIAGATGGPERLVAWPAGADLSASVDVAISDDQMKATAVMHDAKKGGGAMTPAGIRAVLHRQGIRYGVQHEVIRQMVETGAFESEVVVARGQAPIQGKPRRIRYTFDPTVGKPYLMGEFGRINLRELNFVHAKRKGEVLAELMPSEPAQDGRNVLGEIVPALPSGENEDLRAGENSALNAEETAIVALIDGNAYVRANAVHVEPVIIVQNVNYETGNIRFAGTVVVKNEIADGFTVEAGGALEVGTRVGRVKLQAGRQIVLKGGANSNNEGSIECGGDIFARYLENAHVACSGDLVVEEAIMHSKVSAKGNLVLGGRRAEIFGGSAVIGGSLWCRQLGSVAEVPTRISLGVEPGILERIAQTREEIDRNERALEELRMKISYLGSHQPGEGEEAEKAGRALKQLTSEAQGLEAEVRQLIHLSHEQRNQLNVGPHRMVVAEEKLFHGVVVTFGAVDFGVPTKGLHATVLRVVDGRVVENGFSPADPPKLSPASGASSL